MRMEFMDAIEARLAIFAHFDGVAFLLEPVAVDMRHHRIVFNDQNLFHKTRVSQPASAIGFWVSR